VRRGYDPRDFTFVAYGGAGPLHAALLARELGITKTIIPPGPGHFSAFGMLAGDLRGEAVRTVVGPLDGLDLSRAFAPAERAALAELGATGGPGELAPQAVLARYAELRYRGQEHTIEVPVPDPAGREPGLLGRLAAAFEQRCQQAYSFSLDAPLEIVSLRVAATAPSGTQARWAGDDADGLAPPARSRLVDLDPYGALAEIPVLGRRDLAGQAGVSGPCVIEEAAATTLVLPGQAACRDDMGNLVIEERA
jgi:N-methylhydantoinase A